MNLDARIFIDALLICVVWDCLKWLLQLGDHDDA